MKNLVFPFVFPNLEIKLLRNKYLQMCSINNFCNILSYSYQKKFLSVVAGLEFRKIHVSPLGEEDDYCGIVIRKCKTLHQAIHLAVTDTDTISEIILDDNTEQRNTYEVALHDIVFNKSLIIRSKTNDNINPLVKHASNLSMAMLIFIRDNIDIKIESVDWKNIVIASIAQVKNFSLELNKCHFDMSDGFSFIHFSSNIKGIDLKIFNSEVNGNWQWQEYFSIALYFDSLQGGKNAEFINSSFKAVSIKGKGLSNLRIEGCFFKNAAIDIQITNYLYIDQTTFEHARRSYFFEPDSSFILKVESSNTTITNCDFRNNTNSVMDLYNRTASNENITFANNINVFSKGVFLEAYLSNVSFWGGKFLRE